MYKSLNRCAHIASTVQNDGPDPRSKEGAGSIQSERSVLNSFAYVQQVSEPLEGNFRKPKLLVQFYHRNTLVGPTSRQKPFKKWSTLWEMPIVTVCKHTHCNQGWIEPIVETMDRLQLGSKHRDIVNCNRNSMIWLTWEEDHGVGFAKG